MRHDYKEHGKLVWVDLHNPTDAEVAAACTDCRLRIPTREELEEIETSSRLQANGDTLTMSLPLTPYQPGVEPVTAPIGFVLTPKLLVTVRFDELHTFHKVGQKIGSRVLAVIPPADGFGSTGNSSEGIGATDTLVFVIDMDSTFATGSVSGTQTSNAGGSLPTVTAPAAKSTAGPTIKIPAKTNPPTTLQVKTLIKGNGAVVKKGQDIAVQYTGVIWRTGKVFDSSWSRQTPLTTVIGEGQVIPGWDTGLVGQTVGSRVLLVIPPKDGYGSSGASQAGIKGTDTLVFVVDILAAA